MNVEIGDRFFNKYNSQIYMVAAGMDRNYLINCRTGNRWGCGVARTLIIPHSLKDFVGENDVDNWIYIDDKSK